MNAVALRWSRLTRLKLRSRPSRIVKTGLRGLDCREERAVLSNDPANENGLAVGGACPTCGKPATARNRPFCSKRCADVDLQRWLTGVYVIPAVETDGGSDDPSTDDDRAG